VEINDALKKTADVSLRNGRATAAPTGAAGQSTIAATGSASDSVTLSAGAQALAAAGGGAVMDVNKVQEIKAAIASGKFTVDPEKVAQGLIDTVRDLISSRRRD
jgi:negative regulator of flagellin synthesis FlgM